jgi:two-component sensor histidine kinase
LDRFRATSGSLGSVLLREANHRFANHLSLLMYLLDEEGEETPSSQVRERLSGQVAAVALVHRLLAEEGETQRVEVGSYLTELCDHLGKAYLNPRGIRCLVDVVRCVLPADLCRNLGLIVNELVTNAAKHAFPNRSEGLITVVLRHRDGVWTVAVADDGVGLERQDHTPGGMGRNLLQALADGLGARCSCRVTPAGTIVALRFQVDGRGWNMGSVA